MLFLKNIIPLCLEIHGGSQAWIRRCQSSPLLLDCPCKSHSQSSQQDTLYPLASLIDNNRKLHVGFLGRFLGLSQAGHLSQDEAPDCQVKIEDSQLLFFLTLFTDLLRPISFHLGTAWQLLHLAHQAMHRAPRSYALVAKAWMNFYPLPVPGASVLNSLWLMEKAGRLLRGPIRDTEDQL